MTQPVYVALTFPHHATLESLVRLSSLSIAVLVSSWTGYDFHSFGSVRAGCEMALQSQRYAILQGVFPDPRWVLHVDLFIGN